MALQITKQKYQPIYHDILQMRKEGRKQKGKKERKKEKIRDINKEEEKDITPKNA
jgi:hypothetical protein